MSTPVVLRTVVGYRGELLAFWPASWPASGTCAQGHTARLDLGPCPDGKPPELRYDWDGACERCGEAIPWAAPNIPCDCEPDCLGRKAVGLGASARAVYDTTDGKLHPGDAFWHVHPVGQWCPWSNCDGRHLRVLLPNGHEWDVMSRANNCTLPEDKTHRCWSLTGEPGTWTAGKAQPTCSAGAGSILSGDYHGFLQNGVLT